MCLGGGKREGNMCSLALHTQRRIICVTLTNTLSKISLFGIEDLSYAGPLQSSEF